MQVPQFSPNFFSFYASVGRGTVFDGEIVIRPALKQLHCHFEKFTRAVILSDSRAALLAIVSDKNPITQDVLNCRHDFKNRTSLVKTIVLQWVPVHCGVPDNEKSDFLAENGVLYCLKKCFSKNASFTI
ncbi:RNase H domain-containing protein [Trichonephila inaurata madagascariensis]|uniref:RNase H domain-containing protein n=1 Tax=Trichonephila inaurata madagascariensis TaxID=2747483 RepID=A0A8X6I7A7_9ARAC|nr:RNase H domain-containing protein [Trichonephila inaurata madagascariensis]